MFCRFYSAFGCRASLLLIRIFRNRLPEIAAKPLTTAPKMAVIKITKIDEFLCMSNPATFEARMWSLLLSIKYACNPQRKNTAIDPDKNARKAFCGIAAAMIKATTAIIHQGENGARKKLNKAVRIIALINFIMFLKP